mgnify:CR=1 FL=1
MRIYVERNGRPNNYLDNVKKLNEEREKALLEEERLAKIKAEAEEIEKKSGGEEKRIALLKAQEDRLKFVMEHMKELEACDDLNMRQFLMKFIIPLLTEGMIDVWKYGPLDPVDYLADYIYKKSAGK